ncbi:PucR family transcriptional regulator [Gordonia sp. FQ]|uniref:PucR family transcriptional regulator n=1 Tax=Gordonia sp. FQ TaxID=3446634 RepID=UPI003F827782
MPMTVAEIVGLDVVQRADPEVLGGAGLDRSVRWLHVSDVADLSSLLEGGELVLTTGDALRRSPETYLSVLTAAGAVGVLAEVLDAGPDVTARIAAAAAAVGTPVILLRRFIRFVEVTETVHRALVAEHYDEIEFGRRTHETFTRLTLGRAAPAEITAAAAALLDRPVVLENLLHQAVASSGGEPSDLLRDWERRSRRFDPAAPRENWVAVEVGQGEDQWARLVAIDPPVARAGPVLERAAQALVMHRMAERGRVDLERHAQSGLIDDVLAGRARDEEGVAARAAALGLRPGAAYLPMVVAIADWAAQPDPVDAQREAGRLHEVIDRAVRSAGHTAVFASADEGRVAMVLAPRTPGGRDPVEAAETLARALRRDIARAHGARHTVVGVGTAAERLIPAITGLAGAAHVAEVAARMPRGEKASYGLGDIRVRGLLVQLRDDPRAVRFAESQVRALRLDDIERGGGLVEVLRAFLDEAGNKSAVAQRLHISRSALYAKLARIAELLGADLDDGETRTSLHVALLILEAARPGMSNAEG